MYFRHRRVYHKSDHGLVSSKYIPYSGKFGEVFNLHLVNGRVFKTTKHCAIALCVHIDYTISIGCILLFTCNLVQLTNMFRRQIHIHVIFRLYGRSIYQAPYIRHAIITSYMY